MLVKTIGYAVHGISATRVTIEVNVDNGINFNMVGLPDSAVKESQHRVSTALRVNGYKMPGKQITINLAPADVRKEGSAYDLPIAVGILAASEQISSEKLEGCVMVGELALDGQLRPVRGILPMAISAKADGMQAVIVPAANAPEAAVVEGITVYSADTLTEVTEFLEGNREL